MSNDEYTHKNFWSKNDKTAEEKSNKKLVVLQTKNKEDKWFVATSSCPTVYKIHYKDDKAI